MKTMQCMAAAIVMIAAGSAFAQQREFVAPDAGFKPALTRAEVRNDLRSGDRLAWHQRDGQDSVYTAGTESRKNVRSEVARTARARHAVNVGDLYSAPEPNTRLMTPRQRGVD